MSHLKRILGFAIIPLLTMASTILVLPIISSRFGPEGWAALGLGQSLGAFLSVIAGLAWHVVGANEVASKGEGERQVVYAESLKSRAFVFLVLLPIGTILCLVLAPAYRWESVAFMVGTGLNCLTASWFFAGTGQPGYVIRNEAMIRLTAYLASIPALIVFDSLWSYAIVLVVAGVIMAAVNSWSICKSNFRQAWSCARPIPIILRDHFSGMVSRALSAGHQYLGVTMVSILLPQSLPLYTALDNMQKSVNNATAFYPQAFAWWVGSADELEARHKRVKILTTLTLGISVGVFSVWVIGGPLAMRLLYQGEVAVSVSLHVWTAFGMAMFSLSRGLGQLSLVPLGMKNVVYRGTSLCAMLGLPGIVVGLWVGGVAGALAATGVAYAGLSMFYMAAVINGLSAGESSRVSTPGPKHRQSRKDKTL